MHTAGGNIYIGVVFMRLKNKKRVGTLGYHLLTLPAFLLSALVVAVPAVYTFYAAFTDWNGLSSDMKWVGLSNFRAIFEDRVFWMALSNNFKWTLMFITIPVIVGMLSAVLLARLKKGRNFFQVVYLIPYVLAPVTNALIWANMVFSPSGGLVGFLRRIGYASISSPLGNPDTALFGVAFVDIWHYWGFLTVIYLAALRQTPVDQIEAAQIEGVNGWQLFWKVYLPNIAPTVKMMFVFIIIYSFLTFEYVFLLTAGGPAHATEMLSTFAYNMAFSTFRFGRAAAVALVMSFFGAVAAFFYTYLSRQEVAE